MLAISCRWKRLRVVLMMYLCGCVHIMCLQIDVHPSPTDRYRTNILMCEWKKNGHKWISN